MGGRRTEGGKLGERAQEKLREAHQLMKDGQFEAAAERLEAMAQVAHKREMPRVTCWLAVRAARAHARGGNADGIERAVRHAIAAARLDNDKSRSARTFGGLVAVLRETGHDEMADRLADKVREAVGAAPRARAEAPTVNRAMRRNLAKRCGGCGIAVDPDQVEWNDDGTADCGICGSTL
jgi:hypothetical protein